MTILVTGGLGYIGSHIAKIANEKVIIIDNQSNSELNYKTHLPKADVFINDLNYQNLCRIFKNYDIDSVIHLAGSKSVNESITSPLEYYRNNVISSVELLRAMNEFNVNKLIFSSSATVYGNEHVSPLKENLNTHYINPYGHTKIVIEEIIKNCCTSYKNFSAISLRYFNPIGAHSDGTLGDRPKGKPLNLMPLIIDSVHGEKLTVFGNDYPTNDGTCLRDYIHVMDLAEAHLLCLRNFSQIKYETFNVGLGIGISVLELISTFEEVNKVKVKYEFGKRRPGDAAICYADSSKFIKKFNWTPKYDHKIMCKDSWLQKKIKNIRSL